MPGICSLSLNVANQEFIRLLLESTLIHCKIISDPLHHHLPSFFFRGWANWWYQRFIFHYKSQKVFMCNWWLCGLIIAGHPAIFPYGDIQLVGRWHQSGAQMVAHSPQTHYCFKFCAWTIVILIISLYYFCKIKGLMQYIFFHTRGTQIIIITYIQFNHVWTSFPSAEKWNSLGAVD